MILPLAPYSCDPFALGRWLGITQQQLSDGIHVPFQRINELVNGKRAVTPGMSLRLAKFFGVTMK